jgi:hypothetical protein
VAPAVADGSCSKKIKIPDPETGEWIISAPLAHSANATFNRSNSGRFKPLVKLLKFWNSILPETARCKSFFIETIAVRIFSEISINSIEDGLLLYFDFVASRYFEPAIYQWQSSYGMSFNLFSVSVPDAAGTGSSTAARVDNFRACLFSAKAKISRDRLIAARKARFSDTQEDFVLEALRA